MIFGVKTVFRGEKNFWRTHFWVKQVFLVTPVTAVTTVTTVTTVPTVTAVT